ncbi:MAG: flavodoxin [Candidatus Gerdarchaeota archaeon]|nr:MAG: flavodoxin [Candidatus Gerdarchaeota archaeon]RLI69600.1 MAG: flavodoxin [Candidatus Gerdarchaeota archaeon]
MVHYELVTEWKALKSLVVYYSFEKNVKFVGDLIAKELGAEILELKLEKEPKSKDYMKYYLGEKQVLMKTTPKLQPYQLKLKDFDLIIIGTPIWSGTFAPAIRTFLMQEKIEHKKIALFYCFTVKRGRISNHFKKALKGNNIISEIGFKEPLQEELELIQKRIKRWVQKLLNCMATDK